MLARLALIAFLLEGAFGLAFLGLFTLQVIPWPTESLRGTVGATVVVGGYLSFAAGTLVYLLGALLLVLKKQGPAPAFWGGFIPPAFGLPVLIWGTGKFALDTSTAATIFAATAGIGLAVLLARTAFITWRAVPLLLFVAFVLTVDLHEAHLFHVLVGVLLLAVPTAKAFDSKTRGSAHTVRE